MLNAPLPTYRSINRAAGDLEQGCTGDWKADALRKVDVGAQVSGQLKALLVSRGDNVKRSATRRDCPDRAENQIKG